MAKQDKRRRLGVVKLGPPNKKAKNIKDLNYMREYCKIDVGMESTIVRDSCRVLHPNIVMIGDSTEVVEVAEASHEIYNNDRLMLTYAQKIA